MKRTGKEATIAERPGKEAMLITSIATGRPRIEMTGSDSADDSADNLKLVQTAYERSRA